jgi:hypothetical protein
MSAQHVWYGSLALTAKPHARPLSTTCHRPSLLALPSNALFTVASLYIVCVLDLLEAYLKFSSSLASTMCLQIFYTHLQSICPLPHFTMGRGAYDKSVDKNGLAAEFTKDKAVVGIYQSVPSKA